MKKKFKIIVTCAIDTEPTACDHIGVKQGLEDLNLDYLLVDPCNKTVEEISEKIVEFNPDLVVYYMDLLLSKQIPSSLKGRFDGLQVFWEMDYRPLHERIEQSYDGQFQHWANEMINLDHIFMSNKGQLVEWKEFFKVDTSYLPHGCYVLDKPQFDKDFKYPCVFMGGMLNNPPFDERKKLIEKIMELTEITHVNAYDRDTRNKNWTDMPKIYHSSDVVLDISHFWDNPGYASGRYFYSAGLGGCCVTKRFPDCEELYPEGIKIYFDTQEEAAEKIKYYQEHEKEREQIKLKAFQYNKSHHSFKIRFTQLLNKLDIHI